MAVLGNLLAMHQRMERMQVAIRSQAAGSASDRNAALFQVKAMERDIQALRLDFAATG